ncbi:MAG: energy-coupling factor transporter ATPase [Fusobacteria bacterium]|nr:energy-coupling factor transporter ATPase [Fusobacteriota bacterium]
MGIILDKISYKYDIEDKELSSFGIFDISLQVESGKAIGIIGHTGSGKSTLMQHLNALLLPQKGQIKIDDYIINNKSKNLKDIRKKVGMVFQYPEDQLFEETVFKDIAFGPKNIGLKEQEIEAAVKRAMADLELDYEEYKDRSPYELSGGQKRKVAIATVIAMDPDVLVLDEPTAGLDPKSKKDLLALLFKIKETRKLTVFFVSHNMDDIYLFSEYIYVMSQGKIVMEGSGLEVFSKTTELRELGLGVPFSVEVLEDLKKQGLYRGEIKAIDLKELAEVIFNLLGDKND